MLLTLSLLFVASLHLKAEGGKLIMLFEQSPFTEQYYQYSTGEVPPYKLLQEEWKSERSILSVKYSPLGWMAITANNTGYSEQHYRYDVEKNIKRMINEGQKNGKYISSIAFGTLTQWGKKQWFVVLSKGNGITGQVYDFMSMKKIKKWTEENRAKGYQVTALSGAAMDWAVVMSRGTDIATQVLEFYDGSAEMIAGVKRKWSEGYNVQFVECDPSGKYIGVFCTYKDGRKPRQYIAVCKTLDEAKKYMADFIKGDCYITHLGGSYMATLLCNYESEEERQAELSRRLGDLAQSIGELGNNAGDLKASIGQNKGKNSDRVMTSQTPGNRNMPDGGGVTPEITPKGIGMSCDEQWTPSIHFAYHCNYQNRNVSTGFGAALTCSFFPEHVFIVKLKHKEDKTWSLRTYRCPAEFLPATINMFASNGAPNRSIDINRKTCNWDIRDYDKVEIWFDGKCIRQFTTPENCMEKAVKAYSELLSYKSGEWPGTSYGIEIEPVKTGMPASYYQQTYQRWESQVESIYNSVSSYSKIDSDTKEEIEGYSTWSGSSHMMMKQQLVKAQLEMRNIRQEAARNGTNIPMSHWENVTVH